MSPRPRAAPLRLYKKGGARARRHARTHVASQGGAPGAQRVGTYPESAAQDRATEAEQVEKALARGHSDHTLEGVGPGAWTARALPLPPSPLPSPFSPLSSPVSLPTLSPLSVSF